MKPAMTRPGSSSSFGSTRSGIIIERKGGKPTLNACALFMYGAIGTPAGSGRGATGCSAGSGASGCSAGSAGSGANAAIGTSGGAGTSGRGMAAERGALAGLEPVA